MRFSDYLVYEGLRQNNRALHGLGQRQDPLSASTVHELRLVVKRLRAYWLALRDAVGEDEAMAARVRLKGIHKALACARDRTAVVQTVDRLAEKAPSDSVREALSLCSEALHADPGNAVALIVPRDLVSRGFQEESRAWRELDPSVIGDAELIAGYRRCYRAGRRLGLRALDSQATLDLHRWRVRVRMCKEQLELIRPALGEEGAQTLFHLGRLNDTLGKHHDLDMVSSTLTAVDLPETEAKRVGALLELRMRYERERAAKLYPHCYRFAPQRFAAHLRRDLADLDFITLVAARERTAA
jgi:CHAD domain-containing protein